MTLGLPQSPPLSPMELSAERIADTVGESDDAFREVLIRSLTLYERMLYEAVGGLSRSRWAAVCLLDALQPEQRQHLKKR